MEKLSEKIPVDVFLKTITYLPFGDVISACSTNQKFYSYCNDPNYNIRWKNLIDNTFNNIYEYHNILEKLWKELKYEKDTYNYMVYTQLVKLLDPITQLMIYHKQKDLKSFNDPKFNDEQRFLAMYLLNNTEGMEKYFPLYGYDSFLKNQPWAKDLNIMLIKMVFYGNPLGVKLFLDRGADIHASNDMALTLASREGHTETVQLLLDEGADIHAENDGALRWASRDGRTETIKLLLDRGADIHALNDLALRWASMKGYTKIVQLLLDQGANIHALNDLALIRASEEGHTETVKLLLDRGADIHAENDNALKLASRWGQTETVKLLLDRGADIHAENDQTLRWASEKGHTEIVQLLLDRGADIHALKL